MVQCEVSQHRTENRTALWRSAPALQASISAGTLGRPWDSSPQFSPSLTPFPIP